LYAPKSKAEQSYLLQIIELCQMVGQKGVNPFEVDVKEILEKLSEQLPAWKLPEEFVLDVKTLSEIAEIIKLQGDWVKHQSSSLYVDSLLVALKIRMLDIKSLANAFAKAWHPTVAVEQFSQERLKNAVEYWNHLLPLEARFWRLPYKQVPLTFTNLNDLFKMGLLSEKEFNDLLESYWEDLIKKTGEKKEISYWDFIYAEDYESAVFRAYLTSFLVTYGYATLKVEPIEGKVFIVPFRQPTRSSAGIQISTIPISIDYETWKKIKETKSGNGE